MGGKEIMEGDGRGEVSRDKSVRMGQDERIAYHKRSSWLVLCPSFPVHQHM